MKNLDKKQAVLCHRKPLGRQRTRQRYLPQCIIGFLLLLISIAIQAQIPQELIDKARAAGMTEEQIQREIAKHRTEQTGNSHILDPLFRLFPFCFVNICIWSIKCHTVFCQTDFFRKFWQWLFVRPLPAALFIHAACRKVDFLCIFQAVCEHGDTVKACACRNHSFGRPGTERRLVADQTV